jgi:hypothetical protein
MITRKIPGGEASFSAIGQPWAFVPSSPVGDPDRRLRAYTYVNLSSYTPAEQDEFYELHLKQAGAGDEVFETGWYLSGVGHHLLWCAAQLADAVDVAQEHIAWDGQDPLNLPIPMPDEYRPHALHVPEYVWRGDPVWMAFEERRPFPRDRG